MEHPQRIQKFSLLEISCYMVQVYVLEELSVCVCVCVCADGLVEYCVDQVSSARDTCHLLECVFHCLMHSK